MSPVDPVVAPARPALRAGLVLAATWLVATVLAGAVAWWAVTAVGGERGADGAGLVPAEQVERRLAEGGGASLRGDGRPPEGATGGPTPTTTGSPAPSASPAPSPTPTSTPTPSPTAPPPVADPGTAPPAQPPPVEVARTWDVPGGQVGAVCTGATIGLLYATPRDGWAVEVERAGPVELRVEFARGRDDSRVRAECAAGTPVLTRTGGGDEDARVSGGDDAGDDSGGDRVRHGEDARDRDDDVRRDDDAGDDD